jgi:hypothetical protein
MPQLRASLVVSKHVDAEPHMSRDGPHAVQRPWSQVPPAPQLFAQVPQCSASDVRSTQFPPQGN